MKHLNRLLMISLLVLPPATFAQKEAPRVDWDFLEAIFHHCDAERVYRRRHRLLHARQELVEPGQGFGHVDSDHSQVS